MTRHNPSLRIQTLGVAFILTLMHILSTSAVAQVAPVSVISHDHVKVITDPSKGANTYPRWATFPSIKTDYRRVVLYVTYQCPDSQHCGEWDYIDNIYLRRIGGDKGQSADFEIARLISPYGWRFDSTWSFTWHVDITDFAFLLHDSVEIEFNHTGYESNTDRGWVITLDFQITPGRPAMECLGIEPLWHGSIPYGDSTKPIDSSLHRIAFTDKYGAEIARLRILQTGHGMDDSENCAEFCSKWRKVYFDDSLVDSSQIWRTCGDNALYPQAGTWLFDRAGWCPGSIVQPSIYDYPIKKSSSHTVDIEMQPYINRSKPTANYYIYAYLFYYKKPWAENDASIEDIIVPSDAVEYSRLNPAIGNPQVVIRNSGSAPLCSLNLAYSLCASKQSQLHWRGRIESQKSGTIVLPPYDSDSAVGDRFCLFTSFPNGRKDQFPEDNAATTRTSRPPVHATQMILALRSNNQPGENGYRVTNHLNQVITERLIGSLVSNHVYRDTLNLAPGRYTLTVTDSAGDGLDFWANPEGGYGFVRLLDMNGHLLKSFNSDFGSDIYHAFLVDESAHPVGDTASVPIVTPFPVRNDGKFTLDVFFNDPTDATIRIVTEDSTQLVYDAAYTHLKEALLPIDLSDCPDGVYRIKLTTAEKTVTRRIRIKH
jgi:hypothetical protein